MNRLIANSAITLIVMCAILVGGVADAKDRVNSMRPKSYWGKTGRMSFSWTSSCAAAADLTCCLRSGPP
jgi:hypothetical protein